MSFYHYRKDDLRNNIGGKAIHLLHCQDGKYQNTVLGFCWKRDEASLIEFAVFGIFFRWYFRIRSKDVLKRISECHRMGHRIISNIHWGRLSVMYKDIHAHVVGDK